MALESDGERLTLRPVRSGSALCEKQGFWVSRSGRKLSAEMDKVLENLR